MHPARAQLPTDEVRGQVTSDPIEELQAIAEKEETRENEGELELALWDPRPPMSFLAPEAAPVHRSVAWTRTLAGGSDASGGAYLIALTQAHGRPAMSRDLTF